MQWACSVIPIEGCAGFCQPVRPRVVASFTRRAKRAGISICKNDHLAPYDLDMLDQETIDTIARQVATANLSSTNVTGVFSAPTTDSEGRDALRITIVLAEGSSDVNATSGQTCGTACPDRLIVSRWRESQRTGTV